MPIPMGAPTPSKCGHPSPPASHLPWAHLPLSGPASAYVRFIFPLHILCSVTQVVRYDK